jgi:hypothetical protein
MKKKQHSENALKTNKKNSQKKRKKKSSIRDKQPSTSKDLPQNFHNVPLNLKPFVEKDDVILYITPDGFCGFNAPSAHIFEDQKEGKKC